MKASNRKKLATIKRRILDAQFSQLAKIGTNKSRDEEFEESLQMLGDAMMEIERMFGDVD